MWYIYKITNNINGKTYIGQHKYTKITDKYMGSGKWLKEAFIKYGKENFTKEILYSRILSQDTANAIEIFAIKKERAIGKAEYNILDGGQPGQTYWKGKKHTEEYKKAMSESCKRVIHTTEWNKNISEATKGRPATIGMTGKHLSKDAKEKLRKAHLGKHLTAKQKANIGMSSKGRHWYNNGLKEVFTYECPEGFNKGRL